MRKKSFRPQIRRKYEDAFEETARKFDMALRDAISIPRHWAGFEDSVTHRSNGSVVRGAFRNIIDEGNLSSSQTTTITNGTMLTSWQSSDTPVLSVFFGHRTANGYVAGRDWIEVALEEFNPVEDFITNFRN